MGGTILVSATLYAWPFLLLLGFMALPARRVVLLGLLGAWMFLPVARLTLPGLPDYDKMTATMIGLLLGTAVFASDRFITFRPSWVDLPAAVLCAAPLFSSLANGLGLYDGCASSFGAILQWGAPYLLGRFYFNDLKNQRLLLLGLFIGGLIYVPLCLFELRMSPQLHNWVYGYHQQSFAEGMRGGGWRPKVFMAHGLMVGMWMTTATLAGFWLWRSRSLQGLFGVPMALLLLCLGGTAVLCKSTGALGLLLLGVGMYGALRVAPARLLFLGLAAAIVLYLALRATGLWDGHQLVDMAESIVGPERAASLKTRVDAEVLLARHAMDQPVFGWGGWGRNRVSGEYGVGVITDSLWIIVFGVNGLVGLGAFLATMLLPVLLALWRIPPPLSRMAALAPVFCLATLIVLWTMDCLVNYMFNPIYVLMAGALAGLPPVRVAGTEPETPAENKRPVRKRPPDARYTLNPRP